ncbi:MAG: 4Fe-4S binding protein [Firmicutes bacterium]|nr:4Fe-4S binding protein [Bacillota bacterium]MBR4075050.1 4Fe-4S binding protein [Bacillota bacterium]MBR7148864.1 4Fe-4S binding protein [Bacillota bacterium]
MKVYVNKDKCRACKYCIRVCPAKAISMGPDGKAQIGPKCVGCGTCVDLCMVGAIEEE